MAFAYRTCTTKRGKLSLTTSVFSKLEQENTISYIYDVAKLKLQLTIPQASWSPYYFKISCCSGKAQVLANQTSALSKIQRLANTVAGTRENRTPIINM